MVGRPEVIQLDEKPPSRTLAETAFGEMGR